MSKMEASEIIKTSEEASVKYVSCPFNKEHRMPQSRLQWHLVKCGSRKAREHEFANCPHNALHWVLKSELSAHLAKCDSKRQIQSEPELESLDDEIMKYLAQQKEQRIAQVRTKRFKGITIHSFLSS
eukprot:TRINITY_DN5099_c0_g1_i1.p1 TRINITY_DN5099_c0_g1~~TRINITY_DN5099_c0_g1_i1.p1  ORF type:complete len:127 (+),score=14.08 TRINITY_DN5099_c0_g1_i1:114-494(+)